MGRRQLAVERDELDSDLQLSAIELIRSTMSSADYARVDNALGGNSRHIELSKLSGVSKRHIQKSLAGSGMSFEVACRIADAAKVSLDELRLYVHYHSQERSAGTTTPALIIAS